MDSACPASMTTPDADHDGDLVKKAPNGGNNNDEGK